MPSRNIYVILRTSNKINNYRDVTENKYIAIEEQEDEFQIMNLFTPSPFHGQVLRKHISKSLDTVLVHSSNRGRTSRFVVHTSSHFVIALANIIHIYLTPNR